jgi:hypothetical protein
VLVVFSAAAIAGLLGEAFAAVIGASTFFRSRVFRLFGIVCHETAEPLRCNPGVKLLN